MKKTFLLASIALVLLLTGCMHTRLITEQYIKTNIETHDVGKFSTLKTYSIFEGISFDGGKYLEFTGYKYDNKKALLIGADKYYVERPNYKGGNTIVAEIVYIELNMNQCESIIDNYKILLDKIDKEKPRMNENVYHDYTVSKDMFISFKKTKKSDAFYIDFWIKGEKFSVSTPVIMKKLDEFINY